MRVVVSDNLTIDTSELGQEGLRVGIFARSSAGKSNLAALFVEQALEQGWQVVILEPIPEWYTLKAAFPNVICVGGPYADLPIVENMHNMLADFVSQTNASLVLTLSDLRVEDAVKKFAGDFLWALYVRWQKVRRPMLLVIEEAAELAPQMWSREDKPSLSRISMLARHGRKLGINMVLITQRPADIHKSPISQMNVLFFGSFKSAQDLSEHQGIMWIAKRLGIQLSVKEITELGVGEFYCWYRDQVVKIKALRRRTPHGGETPTELKPPSLDVAENISKLREQLEKMVAEQREREDELQALRKENERLRKEIDELMHKIKTYEIVKEIPIEIKTQPVEVAVAASSGSIASSTPEVVVRSPYRQAYAVWQVLKNHPEGISPGNLATEAGVSPENLRKILMWMRRKSLVYLKMTHGYKPRITTVIPRHGRGANKYE